LLDTKLLRQLICNITNDAVQISFDCARDEVAVGEGPVEVVAVGRMLWPRVEVLSYGKEISIA